MINLNDNDRKQLSREYGKVVDTVTFLKGGVCADVFLNKDGMRFSAHINGQFQFSKDGNAVKEWLHKQLEASCALDWVPVIMVIDVGDRDTDFTYGSRKLDLTKSISVDVSRYYVAALKDGSVRAVSWGVPKDKRLTSHDTPYRWIGSGTNNKVRIGTDGKMLLPLHEKDFHIIAYTEELWEGLQQLLKGIDQLSLRLHQMLRTDEGRARLQDVGSRMVKLLTQ